MPKKGSPAYKCGFKAFDTSKIGVYGCKEWKKEARRPVKKVEFAPVPGFFSHTKYSSSFELPTHNKWVPNMFHAACAANKGAYVRRVKTDANTGKYAIEFLDSPNLSVGYHPHLYAYLRANKSTAVISQAIKGDEKTNFQFEYRDYAPTPDREYAVGPLYHYRNNAIYVYGKKITDVKPGQWFNVVVKLDFTPPLDKIRTWTLEISQEGSKSVKAGPFKCSPLFKELEWIGWLSISKEKTSLFLDDFKFEIE
jgi:hypothetical protein